MSKQNKKNKDLTECFEHTDDHLEYEVFRVMNVNEGSSDGYYTVQTVDGEFINLTEVV